MAHGTWLGVSERGRFAAVTNVREPGPHLERRSRGALAAGFLTGNDGALERATAFAAQGHAYGAFNLILADSRSAVFVSNRGASGVRVLRPGVYGLSNAALDTPWPKTEFAKRALSHWLDDENKLHPEALFAAFKDESRPPDSMLPDTGVGYPGRDWFPRPSSAEQNTVRAARL